MAIKTAKAASSKRKDGIEISLTDFIDFVGKSGTARITKVKQIKTRDEYHPASDFYKPLREGIIELHEQDGKKAGLDALLAGLTDEKKMKNYPAAVEGYKKFWGRKKMDWFAPPHTHWKIGELDMKINPELGLCWNDQAYVIKLYLKAEKLTKDRVGQILSLMESQLRKKTGDDTLFCVLDMKNAKLFCNSDKDKSQMTLLESEAIGFEALWKRI